METRTKHAQTGGIDTDDRFYLPDIGLLVTARTGTGEDWRPARLQGVGFLLSVCAARASEHTNTNSESPARDDPSSRACCFALPVLNSRGHLRPTRPWPSAWQLAKLACNWAGLLMMEARTI